MSAPDPEPIPPGDNPPEDELPLVMPTSGDRVRPLEEDRKIQMIDILQSL